MELRMRLPRLVIAAAIALALTSPAWAIAAGWVWEFPATASYTAAAGDNGMALSPVNVPNGGATMTVALPAPGSVSASWTMGFGTDSGHGVIINAPGGVYILAGQKTLTSLTMPSNTNYEFLSLGSDGTNFRLISATRQTALLNGLIGSAAGGESWTYLASAGYSATAADNGHTLTSALTGGATTITLPSTSLLPNGWTIGLYQDLSNAITVQVNGVSGGSILTLDNKSQSSYAIAPSLPRGFANLQFDGANFRVVSVAIHPPVDAVLDLGFVGDGTTSNSTALASLFALTGAQTVSFSKGTFLIGCPTQQSAASNISLRGAGQDVTTLKLSPSCVLPPGMFQWINGNASVTRAAIRVSGFTIDLNGATSVGPSSVSILGFTGVSHFQVDHVSIINAPSFTLLVAAVAGTAGVNDFTISDNYLALTATATTQNQCILVSPAGGGSIGPAWIERNHCVNTAIEFSGAGIFVRNNDVSGWNFGSGIVEDLNAITHDNVIAGNRIHDSGTSVDSGGFDAAGLELWGSDTTVTGNVISNVGGGGIVNGGNRQTITGNKIFGVGKHSVDFGIFTAYVGPAIYQNGSYSTISGNTVMDDGSNTMTYAYGDQAFAVHGGVSTGVMISGNTFGAGTLGNVQYPFSGTNYAIDSISRLGIGNGEVLIGTQGSQFSNIVSSLAFTGISSSFTHYRLVCDALIVGTLSTDLLIQVGEGNPVTWETASYVYSLLGSNQDGNGSIGRSATYANEGSGIPININPLGGTLISLEVQLGAPNSPALYKAISVAAVYPLVAGDLERTNGAGNYVGDNNVLTAIRVIPLSGNLSQGLCSLYGLLH